MNQGSRLAGLFVAALDPAERHTPVLVTFLRMAAAEWRKLVQQISHALAGERRIREWLLAILRFAVTLAQCDRGAVMCLAAEMDRLGPAWSHSAFRYFTKTSIKFCNSIVEKRNLEKAAELRFYLKNINDDRLRRALEAAIFEKPQESAPPER